MKCAKWVGQRFADTVDGSGDIAVLYEYNYASHPALVKYVTMIFVKFSRSSSRR